MHFTQKQSAAIRPLMFAPIETITNDDRDVFERRIPDAVHGREVCATPVRAEGEMSRDDARECFGMLAAGLFMLFILLCVMAGVR